MTAPATLEPVVLPTEGFVRLDVVLAVLPISKTTWYRGIREGRFPRPINMGPNCSMWDVSEIRAAFDALRQTREGRR